MVSPLIPPTSDICHSQSVQRASVDVADCRGGGAQAAGTKTLRAKDSKMTEEEECINEEAEL